MSKKHKKHDKVLDNFHKTDLRKDYDMAESFRFLKDNKRTNAKIKETVAGMEYVDYMFGRRIFKIMKRFYKFQKAFYENDGFADLGLSLAPNLCRLYGEISNELDIIAGENSYDMDETMVEKPDGIVVSFSVANVLPIYMEFHIGADECYTSLLFDDVNDALHDIEDKQIADTVLDIMYTCKPVYYTKITRLVSNLTKLDFKQSHMKDSSAAGLINEPSVKEFMEKYATKTQLNIFKNEYINGCSFMDMGMPLRHYIKFDKTDEGKTDEPDNDIDEDDDELE